MTYAPKDKQIDVITSTAPVVVVLGGAGTGKTTTAVAAARRHLEQADEELAMARRAAARDGVRTRLPAPERALFLSFSRTAVAQIIDPCSRGHRALPAALGSLDLPRIRLARHQELRPASRVSAAADGAE